MERHRRRRVTVYIQSFHFTISHTLPWQRDYQKTTCNSFVACLLAEVGFILHHQSPLSPSYCTVQLPSMVPVGAKECIYPVTRHSSHLELPCSASSESALDHNDVLPPPLNVTPADWHFFFPTPQPQPILSWSIITMCNS